MPLPTDRGFAVLREHGDGSTTVEVCAAINAGQPVSVHARHARQAAVSVDPAVHLVDAGTFRYTTGVVEVFGDGGTISVRNPVGSLRPLVD